MAVETLLLPHMEDPGVELYTNSQRYVEPCDHPEVKMIKTKFVRAIYLVLAITAVSLCQDDPSARLVPGIRLENEPVIDGIVRISQAAGLAVSIEYPLGELLNESPPLPVSSIDIEGGTLTDVLNRLVAVDNFFAWQRSGNMINVFPRSTIGDTRYIMNRTLSSLSYDRISDVQEAVFSAARQLPPPKEQIAMMQTGTTLELPKPWTTTLHGLTIREVLNRIVVQIGPQYGWELSGSNEFRLLTFHSGYSVSRVTKHK